MSTLKGTDSLGQISSILMAQYDVFQAPEGKGFLLDVQSDLLEPLNTRVVVPLMTRKSAPMPAERLNPIVRIGRRNFVMVTQFLAAVPLALLTRRVDNLPPYQDEIRAAIDMLTHGF